MINIKKIDKNIIHYECDCGTTGVCSFKPIDTDSLIVFDVRCPNCFSTERITILQYRNKTIKNKIVSDLDNIDLTWSPTLNEELGE